MAGRRLIYFAVLCGSLVFYAAYQEWLAWILLLTVLGLPWFSLALSLPAMLCFRTEAEGPERIRMGVRGTTWLLGVSVLPMPLFRGKLRLHRCTTGEEWVLKAGGNLPTEHCGAVTVTPEKCRVYDYLGLFALPVRKKTGKTILVRPVLLKMKTPPDFSHFLAQAWRPKPGGGFAENHELRLYRPGDSLNQVHWKLSAKTGKLIIREPMEPDRRLVLLTLDLRGTAAELDRKFGRLLWLGNYMLELGIRFEIRALTGDGVQGWPVTMEYDLNRAVDALLRANPAAEGSIREQNYVASWQRYIGGEPDEA